MEPTDIPCISAQWTHEAAHEGRPFFGTPKVGMAAHEGRALTRDPCLCLGIGDDLHGMTSHIQILRFYC